MTHIAVFFAFVHGGKAFKREISKNRAVYRGSKQKRGMVNIPACKPSTLFTAKYTFYCQVHIFQRTGPAVQAAYVRVVLCTLFMFPYTFSKRTGMQGYSSTSPEVLGDGRFGTE